jgi:hypothetical protein
MPVDQASTCGDERSRIIAESPQRLSRFHREQRRTGSIRPGHVPKPLDGVHHGDLTNDDS